MITAAPATEPASLLVDRPTAARMLCVSVKTIDRMAARGELASVPLGGRVLFSVRTLEDMVRRLERPAKVG